MQKNIAILIGVSDYVLENKLPACEADVNLMAEIIAKSGKYADQLILNASPKSIDGKKEIAQFIRAHEGQEIDEILFYYSGHGSRISDDFLFLFSDYNRNKPEQTSLRNTELDSMLRSLKPKLAVKVVDACQAGTEYIKADTDLKYVLEKSSSASFDKTYFFLSSSQSQSSIALSDFSVFTKSFAEAVEKYKGSEVRFRDIMAHISDDDRVTRYQTPLFIQQANNTEVFCVVTPDVADAINIRLFPTSTPSAANSQVVTAQPQKLSVSQILIEEARRKSADYCDKETAMSSLDAFIAELEAYKWPEPIASLYTPVCSRLSDNL